MSMANRTDTIRIQVTRTGYFGEWETSPVAYGESFVAIERSTLIDEILSTLDRIEKNRKELVELENRK